MENHEDESRADEDHDDDNYEYDYQDVVDILDFFRIIFGWCQNQQFCIMEFGFRLDASVVSIDSNHLLGFVGNLTLLLGLQVLEDIQMLHLDWVYFVDDVPIYFNTAWWRRH